MSRLARVEVFAAEEVAIVHVMNRTVRRCFLMGDDPLTGKNFNHRKNWMERELKRLAAYFGIDLLCYAVMSNHFHLVLRSRPDVVEQWDDTEVARRWLKLCPSRKVAAKQELEPTESELNSIRNDLTKCNVIRRRLSDISWWMRLLSQRIAQRANREDGEVGKFWQARYRAVRLLDEAAVLACAAYVDLNPVRAAMAETIEESDFTSVQKRVLALQVQQAADESPADNTTDLGSEMNRARKIASADCRFLAPLTIDEVRDKLGPRIHDQGHRASNKGFLPLSVAGYAELLDWTARQIREGKPSATPADAEPIFGRLGIVADAWTELVRNFGKLFYSVAGRPHIIDSHRGRRSSHRYKVRPDIRRLLAP
jgi:hypothetical protein